MREKFVFRDGCQECQEVKEKLLDEINNGNLEDLARKYEMRRATLHDFRHKHGYIHKKNIHSHAYLSERKQKLDFIKVKRQEGLTYEQIGKLLNITRQAVQEKYENYMKLFPIK